MTAEKPKKRRLVQGKDYHGWAWKADDCFADGSCGLFHWAEPYRPNRRNGTPTEKGRWVKVKFVEVS